MKKRATLAILLLTVCVILLAACKDGAAPSDSPTVSAPSQTPSSPSPASPSVSVPPGSPNGPAGDYIADFTDGKTGYLLLNTGSPDTDANAVMEIADAGNDGGLKMTVAGGRTLRLGLDVNAILGSRSGDLRTVVFDVYVEYPDGTFRAVEGSINAYDADLNVVANKVWSVYLASRNPNQATLSLDAGSNVRMLEFTRSTDGAYDAGERPSIVYIKSIAFYDDKNTAIPINTDAMWAGPEAYGEAPAMITARPKPGYFVDEGAGKRRFPIADMIGPYATITIVYTPAPDTGDLEVIFKSPDHGHWAQCKVDSITEEGAQRRAVITAESIEKQYPGCIAGAAGTSERGVVLTNWNAGTSIDEIIIEGALGIPADATDFTDEGGGKLRFAIADLISPFSEIRIRYVPAPDSGNLEIIVKSPDHGYWAQCQVDEILTEGSVRCAIITAESIEKQHPGCIQSAAGTDERGVVITNWNADTVIKDILILSPLVP